MAVQVKLFTTLVKLSKTQEPNFSVDWRDGMTVRDIINAEGFGPRDAEAIAAIVNMEQADFETVLHDGDAVELIVNLQGGAPR